VEFSDSNTLDLALLVTEIPASPTNAFAQTPRQTNVTFPVDSGALAIVSNIKGVLSSMLILASPTMRCSN
jgi:hypothetical protein